MKSISESKTIKWQVISVMLAAILSGLAVFEPVLSGQVIAMIAFVFKVIDSGVNTYLRLVTNQPIKRGYNESA